MAKSTPPVVAAVVESDRDLAYSTIRQLQRAIAALDIARDIMVAGMPAYTVNADANGAGIVADLQRKLREAQSRALAAMSDREREYIVSGSRIGADHLRNIDI